MGGTHDCVVALTRRNPTNIYGRDSVSLISEEQSVALGLSIAAAVALSLVAEQTRLGKAVSATIVAMVLGIVLSNVEIVPRDAPIYGHIFAYLVPVALPLFLYDARWSRIAGESGRLLYLFLAGAFGVVAGAALAMHTVDLGALEADWAGTFAASYIGGTINFVAVSTSLDLPREEVAIALSTDTVLGTGLLMLLVIAPGIKAVSLALPGINSESPLAAHPLKDSKYAQAGDAESGTNVVLWGAIGVAISLVIVLVATCLSRLLDMERYSILVVTLLTLFLANAAPSFAQRLGHSFPVGIVLMLSFFFVIGASADIPTMIQSGRGFMVFLFVLIATHLFVLAVVSRVFRFSLSEAVVASCACAIGPTVAAAVAANKNWKVLVTPGIVCGVLGYAIANFIGVGLAGVLS